MTTTVREAVDVLTCVMELRALAAESEGCVCQAQDRVVARYAPERSVTDLVPLFVALWDDMQAMARRMGARLHRPVVRPFALQIRLDTVWALGWVVDEEGSERAVQSLLREVTVSPHYLSALREVFPALLAIHAGGVRVEVERAGRRG